MKDSEKLSRIDQKLTDFIHLYTEHRAEDRRKFDVLDATVKKVDRLERPLKWAAGTVTLGIVGAFTLLGEKTIQWTLDALHAGKSLPR